MGILSDLFIYALTKLLFKKLFFFRTYMCDISHIVCRLVGLVLTVDHQW